MPGGSLTSIPFLLAVHHNYLKRSQTSSQIMYEKVLPDSRVGQCAMPETFIPLFFLALSPPSFADRSRTKFKVKWTKSGVQDACVNTMVMRRC